MCLCDKFCWIWLLLQKRVLDITNSECLLTICLACEGLSFDLAAIAVNSTSFFNVSMFELRDLMVCYKKNDNNLKKPDINLNFASSTNKSDEKVQIKCDKRTSWKSSLSSESLTFIINSFSAALKFFFSSLEIKSWKESKHSVLSVEIRRFNNDMKLKQWLFSYNNITQKSLETESNCWVCCDCLSKALKLIF